MKLRYYQKEILDKMNTIEKGSYLIQLPTGCGKTIIFTTFINNTDFNVLILSHREELVNQPLKYINRSTGIEKGKIKANNESVISTCIPTMVKRLDKYPKDYFDVIITDEAHHASAQSYQKIYNYFDFKWHFGFTATPNRNDGVTLKKIFSKIIYKMDLLKAIKDGFLTDIECIRSFIDYDLTKVRKNSNDYNLEDLDKSMEDTAKGIAKVYYEKAKGQTLIFGTSVKHCEDIQKQIPDSVLVDSATKNRSQIIEDFTNKKFRCLINCMIFTEGTDLPLIETIIIARPTKNESLYSQMVGRGLRLYEGKSKLRLIDCVGVSNDLSLCTAPTLIGIDYKDISKNTEKVESLFDLPEIINKEMDIIDNWKINHKLVNLWSKKMKYKTHNINWYKLPNGDLTLKLPKVKLIRIPKPDHLGMIGDREYQEVLDSSYEHISENFKEHEYLWNLNIIKAWGKYPASEKQLNIINKMTGYSNPIMTKLEASQILNRLFNK